MTPEWEANIEAISNILDRDRAEIASLKDQLIERLAEINEKDAQLEKARLLDITRCGHIGILEGQLATALREREGR